MKIFIINLKRSEGRRVRIEKALSRLGLAYEIFEAVDGYKLSTKELNGYIDPNNDYPRPFKAAEVGCFLSHYLVFKKIVNDNIPHALILEDDVEFSDRLPYVLNELEKHIRQNEVISLYSSFPDPCNLYSAGKMDKDYAFIKPYPGELVVGNVAYIMTHSVAAKMVDALLPMNNVIDDWKYWISEGYLEDFKILFPHPIDLSDNYSDIHESYGGPLLEIKKMMINNFPSISKFILKKRKKDRWEYRKGNILIDSKHPNKLFY